MIVGICFLVLFVTVGLIVVVRLVAADLTPTLPVQGVSSQGGDRPESGVEVQADDSLPCDATRKPGVGRTVGIAGDVEQDGPAGNWAGVGIADPVGGRTRQATPPVQRDTSLRVHGGRFVIDAEAPGGPYDLL